MSRARPTAEALRKALEAAEATEERIAADYTAGLTLNGQRVATGEDGVIVARNG